MLNAPDPVVPVGLNVNEGLWSRKMSFAQWHKKHTVPEAAVVSRGFTVSVIDTHTHRKRFRHARASSLSTR